jgi:hypothetical protein
VLRIAASRPTDLTTASAYPEGLKPEYPARNRLIAMELAYATQTFAPRLTFRLLETM